MSARAGSPAPASILFINVSRIGDTLLATPAVRALAKAWPDARITFLGHPKRAEVFENLPFVTETGTITKQRAVFRGHLGAPRWDLAVVCGFDRPLVRFALRAARRVVAFRQGEDELDRRLQPAVSPPAPQTLHSAEIPLLLTRSLGVPDAGLRLAYQVTGEERRWAQELLRERLPPARRPLVGFQVSSFPTKAYRDWPLERFAELFARIGSRWPDAHLLLFGGKVERHRTEGFAAKFPGRARSFAGLGLRQSAALMGELDLYVGVDTGPTHIMGALEPPMIALYHCLLPGRLFKPLERPRCYVVDHPRPEGCSPETPMAEIPVDAVWEKVLQATDDPQWNP